ncbi:MAG: HemK family protein methyltransferase [Propionibacteriales bacterium]|nr:HemK family protein methyltransferase [Propionibacteriales bacterium]
MIAGHLGIDDAVRLLRAAGCAFAEREAQGIFAAFTDPHDRSVAVERRCSGLPLEYVVGVAEFAGITVAIGPPAFIPRRRAEALVDTAVELTEADVAARPPRALDLGCGCGAIAAALTSRLPGADVHATDIDGDALLHARTNSATFGFTLHQGDWWSSLPTSLSGGFDLVVAHLPYVPTGELVSLPRDFRDHEAMAALDGGADGLDPWRAVARGAGRWLEADGVLLTQVGERQVGEAVRIATSQGLVAQSIWPDDDERVAVISAVVGSRGPDETGRALRP